MAHPQVVLVFRSFCATIISAGLLDSLGGISENSITVGTHFENVAQPCWLSVVVYSDVMPQRYIPPSTEANVTRNAAQITVMVACWYIFCGRKSRGCQPTKLKQQTSALKSTKALHPLMDRPTQTNKTRLHIPVHDVLHSLHKHCSPWDSHIQQLTVCQASLVGSE
jgi:hypothetical protein